MCPDSGQKKKEKTCLSLTMGGSPFQGEDEADWDKAHASAVSF